MEWSAAIKPLLPNAPQVPEHLRKEGVYGQLDRTTQIAVLVHAIYSEPADYSVAGVRVHE